MTIGDKIRKIRIEKNMSQKKLANLTGISQTYISKIEENKRQPTFSKMVKIANALGIPIEQFKGSEE